jgi:hypothetical protein
MLKKRIKKWDLDRKHKEADMLCALSLALPREAQGKDTVFWIRGRLVTFDDVKHYFRRKGVHDLESVMRDATAAAPTTRIDCRTPEPMAAGDNSLYNSYHPIATANMNMHHDFNTGNFHSNYAVVALPDPVPTGLLMPFTATLSQLDQLLHLGRNYYDAVFEKPDWRSNENTFELGSLENFYHLMFEGQTLLDRSRVLEAFQQFDRAFDLVHYLLRRQTFLFLPYLYHLMLPSCHLQGHEVVSRLLIFVSELAQQCYSQYNPISSSLNLLHQMSFEDRGESAKLVFQSILDHLRVEFERDIPQESELRSNIVCQSRANSTIEQNLGNYKMTSIAVWKLAEDADMIEQNRISYISHSIGTWEPVRSFRGEGRILLLHFVLNHILARREVESHFSSYKKMVLREQGFRKFHPSSLLHDQPSPPRSHASKQPPTRLRNKRPRVQNSRIKPRLLPRRGIK